MHNFSMQSGEVQGGIICMSQKEKSLADITGEQSHLPKQQQTS